MTLDGVTVTLINGRVEGCVLIGWPVPGRALKVEGLVRCRKSGRGSGAVRKVGGGGPARCGK